MAYKYSASGTSFASGPKRIEFLESPLFNQSPRTFNGFVQQNLIPDKPYSDSCSAVVDRLASFMKNNFPQPLKPGNVIKSGSLGKGTAVKDKSDADLVVFLNYPNIQQLQLNMGAILSKMEFYLENYGGCSIEGSTNHAVKVSLSCHSGHTHDVDILPSVNILKGSKTRVYDEMRDKSDANLAYYSAALAPLQIEFVQAKPTKVKELIRVVKYWRKTSFKESTGQMRLPTSYPLELIVIGRWETAGSPVNFDLVKGFYHVLLALVDYKNIGFSWTINYSSNLLQRSTSRKPYIIDPANPFNNVMDACDCWDEVAKAAYNGLSKPLFQAIRGVSSNSWI